MASCPPPYSRTRAALAAAALLASLALPFVAPSALATVPEVFEAKLIASDGAAHDNLGVSVSVSGDTAIVGSWLDDDKGTNSGSAYVYVRSGSGWTQQAKIVPSDGAANDIFGASVSVSGNTAIIGSYQDDDRGLDSGSAYIYTRSGTTWTLQTKLVAVDGAAGDLFGYSVSVNNDTAIVGSDWDDDKGVNSGSAYVYKRSGSAWTLQSKIVAADGAAGDFFGISVSVSGDTAIVGSYKDDDKGADSGSAYVFTRSGTAWTQQAKLVPSDGTCCDLFGASVSISADTALIGSPLDDNDGIDNGSAYVYTRSGTTWTLQQKIVPPDGAIDDQFGTSVSLSGDTAIASSYGDDNRRGSAYVYARSSGVWTQQTKIVPSDGSSNDRFGISVSISGDTAAIGSYQDNDNGAASGSAYVYAADRIPPVFSPVSDHVAEATSAMGAIVTFAAPTATDAVSGARPVACAPASGSTFPLGDTTVTCSASDARGNTASTSFLVSVVDTTPPTIDLAPDVTAEATSPSGATVAYVIPATHDLVDGDGLATCEPASGSTFALGATTVTCDASDAAGNVASATSFLVSVVDTTPPVITPRAHVAANASGLAGGIATYAAPEWVDAVDGSGAASCAPASGSLFPLGNTTVTCGATDAAGNAAESFAFNVTMMLRVASTIATERPSYTAREGLDGAIQGAFRLTASDGTPIAGVNVTIKIIRQVPLVGFVDNQTFTDTTNALGELSFSADLQRSLVGRYLLAAWVHHPQISGGTASARYDVVAS